MKRVPLVEAHKGLGAKITEFSGWEMPLSYSGVLEEHRIVRSSVGVFDISHMGRFDLQGQDAEKALDALTTNAVKKMSVGSAQYSLLLNEEGKILDDIVIYKRGPHQFLVCVNAGNTESDRRWVSDHLSGAIVTFTDQTETHAQLAIQGPRSAEVLQSLSTGDIGGIRRMHGREQVVAGAPGYLARSGYTGELGYEFYFDAEDAADLWNRILEAGKPFGILPCGLGARDTLRLEMGYMLYGHDIDATRTPFEASLDWVVDMSKGDFIGRGALAAQREKGLQSKLVGFELLQKGVPREDFLTFPNGKEIGVVTSGNLSPSLNKGIGMGYILVNYADEGSEILIDIRGKTLPGIVVRRPFYKPSKF